MKKICYLILSILFIFNTSCHTFDDEKADNIIKIQSILPEYITHDKFVSIKEYLTGKETTKNRLIIRSTHAHRTGLYLIIGLNKRVSSLPADTRIICEIYMPGELNAKIFEFPLPKINRLPKTKHILLGLTGSDWDYESDALPTAWKVTLIDSNDKIIAEKSSQVWSL